MHRALVETCRDWGMDLAAPGAEAPA
jgi:hypothetical protein